MFENSLISLGAFATSVMVLNWLMIEFFIVSMAPEGFFSTFFLLGLWGLTVVLPATVLNRAVKSIPFYSPDD